MCDQPEPPMIQALWDDVPQDFDSAFVSHSRSKELVDPPGFRLNVLRVLVLLLWPPTILILALAGWFEWGIVGLLAGAVIGALMVPVVAVAAYYFFMLGLFLFIFILSDTLPLSAWATRLRMALRGGIITGCVVCILLTIPRLLAAPTFKEWKQTAGLGIFLPVFVILFLYLDRLERILEKKTDAGDS